MQYLYYIYIVIVAICLLRSIARKDILSFYFTAVLLVDLYMYFLFKKTEWNIHPYAMVFYICFFVYYYRALFNNRRIYYLVLSSIFLIGLSLVFSSDNPYSTPLIVLMSVVYVILPLSWFIKEIITVDEQKITNKQIFWVSTALLFWIIFFIFKMIPLYFFNKQDLEFLLVLDNIYQIATIISYLIFFKSLYHK